MQVDNWVYDEANSTFIDDPDMARRLMDSNPNSFRCLLRPACCCLPVKLPAGPRSCQLVHFVWRAPMVHSACTWDAALLGRLADQRMGCIQCLHLALPCPRRPPARPPGWQCSI